MICGKLQITCVCEKSIEIGSKLEYDKFTNANFVILFDNSKGNWLVIVKETFTRFKSNSLGYKEKSLLDKLCESEM